MKFAKTFCKTCVPDVTDGVVKFVIHGLGTRIRLRFRANTFGIHFVWKFSNFDHFF